MTRVGPEGGQAEVGAWFDAHASALVALATALLGDRTQAEEVVGRALVEAGAGWRGGGRPEGRLDLSRRVYVSCTTGAGAAAPTPLGAAGGPSALSRQQRVALALSIFGGHGYRGVADLVGLTSAEVAELQLAGLRLLRPDP